MLDRYHLEHELGTGARGAVYRGRDTFSGRPVAIKLSVDDCELETTHAQSPKSTEAPQLLKHLIPHTPRCYEAAQFGQLRYLVMELVQGADLRARVSPSNLLAEPTVLSIMARVADALYRAHACTVVHGDVKPANIVFDSASDRVALTDLPVHGYAADTRGTPNYMAPERLCGEAISAASDQFSFAVTLYQLLSGHLPFRGCSRPQILHRIVNEAHPDIRQYDSSIAPVLATALNKALAKDPRARYASMRALASVIRFVAGNRDAAVGRRPDSLRADRNHA